MMETASMKRYVAFAAVALAAPHALAASATQTFSTKITLVSQVIFSTAIATVNFATAAGVLNSNADAQTMIYVQGANTTPYTIGIDQGTGAGATIAARKMSNGPAAVIYALYQDSGRTLLWGVTGTELVSGVGTGSVQSYTVYGRVPSQATPAPGTYSDTLTVTLTY